MVNTLGLKSDGARLYAKLESGSLSDADVDPNCTLSASQYAAFHASPCPLCNMSHDMLYYYEYRAILCLDRLCFGAHSPVRNTYGEITFGFP